MYIYFLRWKKDAYWDLCQLFLFIFYFGDEIKAHLRLE